MTHLLTDIRLTIRSLARRPLFGGVVLLTLGLGIGANTAIFSVVNGILLRPLPYTAPEELALIWSRWSNFDKTWVSEAEYLDYKRMDQVFTDVASWAGPATVTLTGDGGPEGVEAIAMTSNLPAVVGIQPVVGRVFTPEEDIPNGPKVVMVGYDLWRQRYGGDPQLINRLIRIDGESYTVVGILPREFRFPLEFQGRSTAQVVVPIGYNPSNPSRGSHGAYAVGRLRPGMNATLATDRLRLETARWTEDGLYPEAMRFTAFAVSVADEVQGGVRTAILVLLGAVGLLLLLTCANVANLLLTRADGRAREIAVRAALGAGKAQILRMAFTESITLGLGGGILGLLLAWGGVRLLVASAPAGIPRVSELTVDGGVLLFALVLSLGTGVLFGLVPAFRTARLSLAATLRDGGRAGESTAQHRGRALLVVAEMALAVMLVIGAGLTIRSFQNLTRLDPGFDARNVLTMSLSLSQADYPTNDEVVRFFESVTAQVRAVPGVRSVGLVRALPLATEIGDAGVAIEGRPTPPGEPGRQADWQVVSDGYFETMGMRLVEGRFFDRTDTQDGLQVVAINETMAEQYFPGEAPIGKRIRVFGRNAGPWRVIVGVIGDTRHNGLTNPTKRKWFVPHNQFANSAGNPRRAMTLVVRTEGRSLNALRPIESIVHAMNPDLPVTEVRTMEDVLGVARQGQRFTTGLMTLFAMLAMMLAGVGVYGVISYSIGRRTQEIGIRLALGADRRSVLWLVFRQGMLPALVGIGLGIVGAMLLSQSMSTLLYAVEARDIVTFVTIPVLLVVVATVAVMVPVRRALRIGPMEALRYE